jgi:hypothetical protein
MNIPEREQLSRFLQQLAQAQAGAKDTEAQALITEAVARQPDATYLLVQRCLLQDNALQTAQAQIASLQTALQQAKPAAPAAANFLDVNSWGRAPVAPTAAYAAAPGYPQAAPVAAAAPSRFQAPSFLTSMATTAAGVAAGAFLFQGIGSLMGNHASSGAAGTAASAFGLSEPTAAAPEAAQSIADASTDVFGNGDGLDAGGDGSSDWA